MVQLHEEVRVGLWVTLCCEAVPVRVVVRVGVGENEGGRVGALGVRLTLDVGDWVRFWVGLGDVVDVPEGDWLGGDTDGESVSGGVHVSVNVGLRVCVALVLWLAVRLTVELKLPETDALQAEVGVPVAVREHVKEDRDWLCPDGDTDPVPEHDTLGLRLGLGVNPEGVSETVVAVGLALLVRPDAVGVGGEREHV